MEQRFIRAAYRASDRRYVAKCPLCGMETRISFEKDTPIARCSHVVEVERVRAATWVLFRKRAA